MPHVRYIAAECSALILGGEASAPPDVRGDAVAAQHHRQDVGIAGEPTHGRHGDVGAVVELADRVIPEPAHERVEVDECKEFDPAGSRRAIRRRGEADERSSREVGAIR